MKSLIDTFKKHYIITEGAILLAAYHIKTVISLKDSFSQQLVTEKLPSFNFYYNEHYDIYPKLYAKSKKLLELKSMQQFMPASLSRMNMYFDIPYIKKSRCLVGICATEEASQNEVLKNDVEKLHMNCISIPKCSYYTTTTKHRSNRRSYHLMILSKKVLQAGYALKNDANLKCKWLQFIERIDDNHSFLFPTNCDHIFNIQTNHPNPNDQYSAFDLGFLGNEKYKLQKSIKERIKANKKS